MKNLGLDIGYSNLKMCHGNGDKQIVVKPVGVIEDAESPVFSLGKSFEGAVKVQVDGKRYVACVEPALIHTRTRSLHEDYANTADYRALFHAALLMSESPVIDRMVTGLPVEHFMDKTRVSNLKALLKGEHKVTPKRTVEVKEVFVTPQPLGGYMSALADNPDIEDMSVLVVDPGFFSVDWVIIERGTVIDGTLGTSTNAMSVVLERASELISLDHGGKPALGQLEAAIRGDGKVMLFGERIEIASFLKEAAKDVCRMAMSSVRNGLRNVSGMNVDAILMVGGGASLYEPFARELYPRAKCITPEHSVAANAIGFWRFASWKK